MSAIVPARTYTGLGDCAAQAPWPHIRPGIDICKQIITVGFILIRRLFITAETKTLIGQQCRNAVIPQFSVYPTVDIRLHGHLWHTDIQAQLR